MGEKEVLKALRDIVGKERILIEEVDLVPYSRDANVKGLLPLAVVFPKTTEEVKEIVKVAMRDRVPLFPRGSGTGMTGGAVPTEKGIVVCTVEMNQIKEISWEDGLAVVEPGVINERLQCEAVRHGLFFPPDPSSYMYSTIGGNVAENAGGPRAVRYGVTRDYVLGLEVVIGTGEVLRTGTRAVKDVVGYDLTGLLVGSEGTLGIFTEITLKLLPLPEAWGTVLGFFSSMEGALKAVLGLFERHLLPSAIEFMDGPSIRCARAFLGVDMPEAEALLIVELGGDTKVLQEEAKKVQEVFEHRGAIDVVYARDFQQSEGIWRIRRCLSQASYALGPVKVNEDVVVPRGKLPFAVEEIHRIAERNKVHVLCFGHVGDGNIHVNFMVGHSEEERERAEKAVEELFELVVSLGGSLSGEHGVGVSKLPYIQKQLSPTSLRLMADIKKAFDPLGILNPGKGIRSILEHHF